MLYEQPWELVLHKVGSDKFARHKLGSWRIQEDADGGTFEVAEFTFTYQETGRHRIFLNPLRTEHFRQLRNGRASTVEFDARELVQIRVTPQGPNGVVLPWDSVPYSWLYVSGENECNYTEGAGAFRPGLIEEWVAIPKAIRICVNRRAGWSCEPNVLSVGPDGPLDFTVTLTKVEAYRHFVRFERAGVPVPPDEALVRQMRCTAQGHEGKHQTTGYHGSNGVRTQLELRFSAPGRYDLVIQGQTSVPIEVRAEEPGTETIALP